MKLSCMRYLARHLGTLLLLPLSLCVVYVTTVTYHALIVIID